MGSETTGETTRGEMAGLHARESEKGREGIRQGSEQLEGNGGSSDILREKNQAVPLQRASSVEGRLKSDTTELGI